jgi:phosphatidylserine/phosphatidylglycerophosphate/cardiolipin synthase-like enzyme
LDDYEDWIKLLYEDGFHRRLSGYAAIGYKAKGESISTESINSIFDKSNFLPIYTNDILNSVREVLIVSPFITKKRVLNMMQYLEIVIVNKVRVIVVTRPVEQLNNKDTSALQLTLDLLKDAGVSLVFKANIHQKFAVIDEKVVWYGSINLLSFGTAEESIMRLESSNIANELIKSIIKD